VEEEKAGNPPSKEASLERHVEGTEEITFSKTPTPAGTNHTSTPSRGSIEKSSSSSKDHLLVKRSETFYSQTRG
jgi:hypothetical protein